MRKKKRKEEKKDNESIQSKRKNGFKLGYCKLSALPNGELLKVGDYEMIMMIDAYDPKTNEKAIVNAQAMTTIHVVDR